MTTPGTERNVKQAERFVQEHDGRVTFQGKCEGEAWQKQLRDRYLHEGAPPVDLKLKRARVIPVTRRLAEHIIFKYEWLGTMVSTGRHYGIFFGPYCAGVTCSGVGCTGGTNTAKMFGLETQEMLTFARGACVHWAPTGANSKLVSWSCRHLAEHGRLTVAYADTDAGEIGTIYQACGWTYIGKGSSTRQWVSPEGKILDQKTPGNLVEQRGFPSNSGGWLKGQRAQWVQAMRDAGWVEQITNPKHRYVKVLRKRDKELHARIADMAQPYPKRVGTSAAAASQ